MALAQADAKNIRLYAMSVAILNRRRDYYRILEQRQRSDSDVKIKTIQKGEPLSLC